MYSTQVYLYQQITKVLMIDTSGVGATFQRRWDPVYAKTLTINKGVDNVILFEFINQDQKPVNITGSTFVFRIINTDGNSMFYSKELVTLNAATGRAKVTILAEETAMFPAEPAGYSIERTSGNLDEAVFVDAQAQARAMVNIVDSVYPEFVPSQTCTIPTVYGPETYPNPVSQSGRPDWALPAPPSFLSADTERFTSHVPSTGQGLTTFQLELDHFTGNIKAQAAQNYESTWFNVGPLYSYYDKTGVTHINVEGYHPLLRLSIDSWGGITPSSVATATVNAVNGVVTSVTITNAGSGYIAAPKVTIGGLGAGAIAEAEIVNGSVTAINVINGGSGYVPNPLNNVPAYALISTGFITDITYR